MAEGNELLALFERYNPDVWPLPILGYVLAVVALGLIALRPGRTTDRLVTAMLALAWLWLGVVFQGIYVREVSAVLGVAGAVVFISGAASVLASLSTRALRGLIQRGLALDPLADGVYQRPCDADASVDRRGGGREGDIRLYHGFEGRHGRLAEPQIGWRVIRRGRHELSWPRRHRLVPPGLAVLSLLSTFLSHARSSKSHA